MYICENPKQVEELFDIKHAFPFDPIIKIIDPSKRIPVEKIKQTKNFLSASFNDNKEEV